jgi:hypothetical protein
MVVATLLTAVGLTWVVPNTSCFSKQGNIYMVVVPEKPPRFPILNFVHIMLAARIIAIILK